MGGGIQEQCRKGKLNSIIAQSWQCWVICPHCSSQSNALATYSLSSCCNTLLITSASLSGCTWRKQQSTVLNHNSFQLIVACSVGTSWRRLGWDDKIRNRHPTREKPRRILEKISKATLSCVSDPLLFISSPSSLSSSSSWPGPPSVQGSPYEQGPAQGFFLLKGSFSLPGLLAWGWGPGILWSTYSQFWLYWML